MDVDRCAIGVIRKRGADLIDAQLITLGPAESDYFVRHVEKVRQSSTCRALFASPSAIPSLLSQAAVATDEALVQISVTLQHHLATSMRTATNAKDCVFAVVRGTELYGGITINLLKLDAVIEAGRFDMLKSGRLTFEVLHQLLPEPGELQKGLSWPDARPDSDVMMVDRNVVSAMYFEHAFDVAVSMRSFDAERDVADRITARLSPEDVPGAIQAAGQLSGPADEVLRELGQQFPPLVDEANAVAGEPRPPGHIRSNKVASRRIVWRADGVEVHVPAESMANVAVSQIGDEWEIRIRTRSQPHMGT